MAIWERPYMATGRRLAAVGGGWRSWVMNGGFDFFFAFKIAFFMEGFFSQCQAPALPIPLPRPHIISILKLLRLVASTKRITK